MIIGRRLDINSLPDDVLEEVFEYVWNSEGDAAIVTLSLVCSRWRALVGSDLFRRRVHFKWLSSVHDWKNATAEFRETYYVMYVIRECFGCQKKYKDTPGFMRRGKGSLVLYSDWRDANHAGYCSEICGSAMGPYSDPFDGWSEPGD